MAEYNHRICERCWFDGSPERLVKVEGERQHDGAIVKRGMDTWELEPQGEPIGVITEGEHQGAYKMPVQAVNSDTGVPDPGPCCFCGGMTITGIFTRIHENKVLCKGRHAEDQLREWSRVGV